MSDKKKILLKYIGEPCLDDVKVLRRVIVDLHKNNRKLESELSQSRETISELQGEVERLNKELDAKDKHIHWMKVEFDVRHKQIMAKNETLMNLWADVEMTKPVITGIDLSKDFADKIRADAILEAVEQVMSQSKLWTDTDKDVFDRFKDYANSTGIGEDNETD